MRAARSLAVPARRGPGSARAGLLTVVTLLLAVVTVGCSSSVYAPTPLPSVARAAATPSAKPTPAPTSQCLQSYAPLASVPAPRKGTGPTLAAIYKRGYLRAGVSADSLLLGSRNPLTGRIEGFDIDMLRAVSQALFGSPDRIRFVVMTAVDRIPRLQHGDVDVVARAFSITCDRWKDVAFSAEYYQAGQKVLVPKGSTVRSLAGLRGKRVCAPAGSTTLSSIARYPGVVAVPAATHTACLVLFQQSKVDAITGDDTVLAGLARQDPYAVVVGSKLTSEPYGLGMRKGATDLVRLVNAVLVRMHRDGSWTRSYDHWLKPALKVSATQPTPVYGRS